jgi:hypothetical protein
VRLLNSLFVVVCLVFLSTTCAFAQSVDERRGHEQIEPYHKHHDKLHGHNHVYPDRGAIFREVPQGAVVVNYAGVSYRFRDGVWFEPRGPAFIVVVPPIGLVVPTLPAFATTVESGGQRYLYSNDIYYRARPDLGGYEVVNDPRDEPATAAGSAAAAGAPPTGVPTPATPAASATVIAPPAPTVSDAATGAPPSSAPAAAKLAAASPSTPLATVTAPPAPTVSDAATGAPPSGAPAAATQAAAPPSTAPATVSAPAAGPVPTLPTAPSVAGTLPVLASGPSRGAKVFANPKNGQTIDEQARDHYECYRFGVAQSGFDPMRSNSGGSSAGQSNYERAQAACFEGRGYTIR